MDIKSVLNEPYPLTSVDEGSSTKEKILIAATIMFAQRGVAGVSMRDIAERVAISPASIYNHFESKEVLWEEVLEHLKGLYLIYFERLEAAISQAQDFKAVLDCMFMELFEVVDIFTYYGFSLIMSEQLRDEKAYQIYSDIFVTYSIGFIAEKLDMCVRQGWARAFDTRFVAGLFMQTVLNGIAMRTHEDAKRSVPFAVDKLFHDMYQFIYERGKVRNEAEEDPI